ncbi:MAG: hypothetical protein V4514_21020 [Pseudomonadota bacterium]|uniref:hypothetical protein n=1 Tax=Phenylobacterium sp. TaxID=1871053 RepID=UPI0025D0A63D|nr:hypothetical protein [Phenylobacterium sp.]MBT9472778.1 hypothetical protein [Phenylobacterium sp.]
MLLLAAILGGALAIFLTEQSRTPELLRGLDRENSKADREFSQRITRTFPAGSSEDELIEALSTQGFALKRQRSTPEQEAVFNFSNLACVANARVWWRTDASGRLTAIRSRYGEEGCW